MDRSLLSGRAIASGVLAVGRLRQELDVDLRGWPDGTDNLTPALSVGVAHESIRKFSDSGTEWGTLAIRELFAFVGPERRLGSNWIARAGIDFRAWHEPAGGNASTAGLAARLARAPSRKSATLRLDVAWTLAYGRIEAGTSWPLQIGRARVTPEVRYNWESDLPPQLRFPLGGDIGFPGLHIGERRGDREALFRVSASQPLVGPVRLCVELASGTSGDGGPPVPRGGWLFGARIGVGADLFFGPTRVEYGRAVGGRNALFVRVGRWF